MVMFQVLFQLLVLFQLPLNAYAFYYYGNSGERRCFHKELSKDTLLKGLYKLSTYDNSQDAYVYSNGQELSVQIMVEEVFDDNHRVVNQKGSASGDFTFTALQSGEHLICFQPSTRGGRTKTMMEVEFEVGSLAEVDSKKKSTIQTLQNKVQVLISKVNGIKREQDLVREREAMFRDASESANSRAMWWSVISLIVLGGTCAWQLTHLRTFFVKQKVL
ncbi:unnamed protein product [Kluyveromyces dobzhanskii CBS 2104]|uniref:WGS project CCBQ000000000 data, contig 00107 n=1 Tax=Kluyveromyces dobzhanskii CBS 2104 TaxID=1427455 RepID=A0A0A8L1A5_9SACH|nr:unnamed protein product [Kluyveromyces dobzhanskii CBS 2104]